MRPLGLAALRGQILEVEDAILGRLSLPTRVRRVESLKLVTNLCIVRNIPTYNLVEEVVRLSKVQCVLAAVRRPRAEVVDQGLRLVSKGESTIQ